MMYSLFTDAEACGCQHWTCRRCNPSDPFDGALQQASDWVVKADDWFQCLPKGHCFTSEDVTRAIGFPAGVHALNRNNAVGAWVLRLARRRVIVHHVQVASANPASNGATIWVWRKR